MSMNSTTYIPINCEFHDLLENLALTHRVAEIHFRDSTGETRQRTTVIDDVYAMKGKEFLGLRTGETIRLDALISVDGMHLLTVEESACTVPS